MCNDVDRERQAKQHRQDNARLFVTLVGMVVILAVALYMLARVARIQQEADRTNRDGIACVLIHVDEHQLTADPDGDFAPPELSDLAGACDRFVVMPQQ